MLTSEMVRYLILISGELIRSILHLRRKSWGVPLC